MQKKTRSECHGDAPCDSSKRGPGGDDMERWPPRSYHPTWKQTWKQTPNISTKWGGYVIEYPPEAWHEKVLWNVPKTIQNPIGSCSNPCFRRAVKLWGCIVSWIYRLHTLDAIGKSEDFVNRIPHLLKHVRKSWGRRLHPGWDQVDPNLKRFVSTIFGGSLGMFAAVLREHVKWVFFKWKLEFWTAILNVERSSSWSWDVDAPFIISPPVTFFLECHRCVNGVLFWGCVGPSFWGWVNNYALAMWRTGS